MLSSTSAPSSSSSSLADSPQESAPMHDTEDDDGLCRGCKRRRSEADASPAEGRSRKPKRPRITMRSLDMGFLVLMQYNVDVRRSFCRWACDEKYPATPFRVRIADCWVEVGKSKFLPDRKEFYDPLALPFASLAIIPLLRLVVYNMQNKRRNTADLLRKMSGEMFVKLCDCDSSDPSLPPRNILNPCFLLRRQVAFAAMAKQECSLDEWWLTTVMSELGGTAEFSLRLLATDVDVEAATRSDAHFQALLLDHRVNPPNSDASDGDDDDAASPATVPYEEVDAEEAEEGAADKKHEDDAASSSSSSLSVGLLQPDPEEARLAALRAAEDEAALDRLIDEAKQRQPEEPPAPAPAWCLAGCGDEPDALSSYCRCGLYSLHAHCFTRATEANFCPEPTCRALLCFSCAGWGAHADHP